MMKKEIIALAAIGLISAAAPMNASAGTSIPADTDSTGSNSVTTGDCNMLTEDVTINLSKNVEGGYDCGTSSTAIGFGTCHSAGHKDTSGNSNVYVGLSTGGGVDTVHPDDCSDGSGDTAASAASTKAEAAGS